jgi:mRNA interferase MazF
MPLSERDGSGLTFPGRGEIWLVNLDPTVGAEIKKTRPALVVSNDINNRYAETITVLPISDKGHKVYPFEVAVSGKQTGLTKESKIRSQQIRTVDKIRLVKVLGSLPLGLWPNIEEALRIHLQLS